MGVLENCSTAAMLFAFVTCFAFFDSASLCCRSLSTFLFNRKSNQKNRILLWNKKRRGKSRVQMKKKNTHTSFFIREIHSFGYKHIQHPFIHLLAFMSYHLALMHLLKSRLLYNISIYTEYGSGSKRYVRARIVNQSAMYNAYQRNNIYKKKEHQPHKHNQRSGNGNGDRCSSRWYC